MFEVPQKLIYLDIHYSELQGLMSLVAFMCREKIDFDMPFSFATDL